MDSLCLVRPLANAIYGRVLLVRHRSSGRHYALKVMSLPHMHARRAVTGPYVQEDGDMELQILRKLGRNLVYSSGSRDNLSNSWSVSPVWSNGVADDTRAATGGQLGDQHLLTLHQDFVDWTTKTRCLLFDYCPYGDLFSQVSETRDGLSLETARTCFQQISSAVHFLHGRNVAHRDLSLENILLDGFRRCRLADFGLASAGGSRCSGSRVGKILYMAPEVFTRPPYLPKGNVNMETNTGACYNGLQADIWSLGVILFILVTGIPPFEKANEVDARFRLVSKPGGSVRALLHAWGQEDRLPRELQALLDWMLRVDPGQRPTAEQICQHQWLQPASGTRKSVKESGQREKRPSADEPEAEKDGENQDPRKMANRTGSDKSWSWSTLRSNKRVKRMG